MSKSSTKLRILVTGAGGPAGVNALRLLQRQAHVEAFATDTDELAAGRFFCIDFKTMAPCSDAEMYRTSLRCLIQQWGIHVVLPTVAEELCMIRSSLSGTDVRLILSPQGTLDRCHDKRRLYEWISSVCPEYMVRWQTADGSVLWDPERFFLKPAIGRGGRGCLIGSKQDLAHFIKNSPAANDYIVMEYLPGVEWTVDAYVTQDGLIPLLVPRERLGLSGGISVKGRTVKDDRVMEASTTVFRNLPCRGPVCVQWKADASGKPKLVEVNPRLSGGVMITAAAGADPIACMVAELQNGSVPPVEWREITVIRYFDERVL
jgi:carbamoyl-phosphate synthase large subunit